MLAPVKQEPSDESAGVVERGGGDGAGPGTTPMEKHVRQTNERLHCIREALRSAGAFQGAARELLEWCGDPRAFQKVFENNLVGCLTVLSQVSAKPGFDLDLGYRLLALCAAHRDKFSPDSAALLSAWCEELGRLLLLRHQKARTEEGAEPAQKGRRHSEAMGPGGWQPPPPGGPPPPGAPQGPPQQQLSVVTTVWGVATTTQSGPPFGATSNTYGSPPGAPYPPGKQVYAPAQSHPRQQGSGYSCSPGAAPGAPEFQSPPSALSAAALVAAAATATATATASVVALQERQQQQHEAAGQYGQGMQGGGPPFQPSYDPSHPRMGPHPGLGGKGPAYPQQPAAPARSRPYPAPQKRPYALMQQHPHQQQQYGPPYSPGPQQPYGAGQGCVCCSQYPRAGGSAVPRYGGYPPQPGYPQPPPPQQARGGAGLRQPYGPAAPYCYHPQQQPINGAPPTPTPQYDHHYGCSPPAAGHFPPAPQPGPQRSVGYQPLPIPGNPTPPLTPASVGGPPPYLSSSGPPDVKPNFADGKAPPLPMPMPKEDELRLTFPVRDGIILAPFRLEHNLAVSNHVFHLKPSVQQTLAWRSDLELQLKCFHHEDRQMATNWPQSVQVSVNACPLVIDRGGEGGKTHRPLHLKEVCQPGRNTIQITVTACCCSHLFLLQLVHRPTVRSVLQGLLRKRLLPAEHCVAKVKRHFSSSAPAVAAATPPSASSADEGVEQTAIKVSLKCPITFKRITLPARGQDCKHIQCFDLESYLQLNCERGAWRCPVCNKPALLEGLEVDQYIWGILTNLSSSDIEEVTIDATASWKPVPLKTVKEESDGAEPCGAQKRLKATSPGSMTMPTTSAWEVGQGLASPPFPAGGAPPGPPLPPHADATAAGGGGSPGPPPNGFGGGGYEFHSQASDFSPLSHRLPSPALDPLAAMEKTLSQHEQQMGLSTLHDPAQRSASSSTTPIQGPHTPISSGGVAESGSGQPAPDLGDLHFDPAAVIEGEGQGQEALNLLPESVVDPMELLSYLDPPELSGAAGAAPASSSAGSDDLLALFES